MQLDVDAIVSRDVCLCALRVESNNRIQGAPVFFSFYYSSLLVEPFPSHSLLASKCNTRLNQTPIFFVYWRRGTTEQKKKDGTGRYWVLHLEERNCQFACLFSTRRRDDFFLFFLSYFSIQSTFFFYLGPSIEMAVYTLERERANNRLLYYWFSLHLGHFW